MTKRKAVDDNSIPPAKRLLHNVDAMGCLLAATKAEFDKDIKAMHRRVEDLSKEVLILKSAFSDLRIKTSLDKSSTDRKSTRLNSSH